MDIIITARRLLISFYLSCCRRHMQGLHVRLHTYYICNTQILSRPFGCCIHELILLLSYSLIFRFFFNNTASNNDRIKCSICFSSHKRMFLIIYNNSIKGNYIYADNIGNYFTYLYESTEVSLGPCQKIKLTIMILTISNSSAEAAIKKYNNY